MLAYSVVSLFAGCGGKDLGFRGAGFDIVWANDIDGAACRTYARNIGDHIVNRDIRDVSSNEIPSADVVIGGFPCQGFSIVGSRRLDDERNFLYREMKRVIRDKRPSFFVAENVRGLSNMAGGEVIRGIVREFSELGYSVSWKLLNAADYGVPQHRERVFIVGNRLGLENPFPAPTHFRRDRAGQSPCAGPAPRPWRTLRDAIGGLEELGTLPNHEIDRSWITRRPEFPKILPHIGEGQKLCNVRLGPRSVYTWDIPEVFGEVTEREREVLLAIAGNRRRKRYGPKDGNPLTKETIAGLVGRRGVGTVLKPLVAKGYLIRVGDKFELKDAFNGLFRRLRWDEPSEAVLTVFDSPRYYVHPSQDRPFSVRETARIQEFPDDFVFTGSLKEQYTQIGNAVPVGLARAVAVEIRKVLEAAGVAPVREPARHAAEARQQVALQR
jgi:DNA (cytosine-5)-methyltransferase 1